MNDRTHEYAAGAQFSPAPQVVPQIPQHEFVRTWDNFSECYHRLRFKMEGEPVVATMISHTFGPNLSIADYSLKWISAAKCAQ